MPPDASEADALRREMVETQLVGRGIRDARVLAAMAAVPREAFVPDARRASAYADAALPLSEGQTISQPYMVAAMCELLALRGGERALEIGTGSGYAAAVLDELGASVLTIELLPALAATARETLAATGHGDVEVRVADGTLGAPAFGPFDAVLVSAAARDVPSALVDQLADGGRLVAPVGPSRSQRLVVLERDGDRIVRSEGLRCRFVPLLGAGAGQER